MESQLWIEASDKFRLPGYPNREGSQRWSAPKLRALFWPSGKICWEINMYLLAALKSGLAVSTLNTYASELSLLVKFLHEKKVAIRDVDDDLLILYSDYLLQGKRSRSHVNRLIMRSLKYLIWYQQTFFVDNLIGKSGEGCKVAIGFDQVGAKRGALATRIRHISMVPPSTSRTVRPISYQNVLKLVAACKEINSSTFKSVRDRCIITLLADTGIRREEATWIRCIEVKDAVANGGRLRIRTSKRKGNPLREIPVPQSTLELIDRFIDLQRALHMRKMKRRSPGFLDRGWLFCGYGGNKLAPVTLTQIFNDLRAHAGIRGRATPHMLRHRYITLQIITRLNSLQHSNVGLEMLSTILSQVASLTGHSSVDSLWTYVDWAFEELDAFKDSFDFDYSQAISVLSELKKSTSEDGKENVSGVLKSCIQLLQKQANCQPRLNPVSHSLRK